MMRRRTLLAAGAAALACRGASTAATVKFGLDLFSLRSQGWTPIRCLDFCAQWGIQVVHFSEVRFLGSLEEENLKQVCAHAEKLGIESNTVASPPAPPAPASMPAPFQLRSAELTSFVYTANE